MIALEIFVRLLMFAGLGFILLTFAGIVLGHGDGYSCAPVEDEDEAEFDPTAEWDRAHDRSVDREVGLAW